MQSNTKPTNQNIRRLTFSALCLALCLLLPFVTGQIPQVGSTLCPMHLPVFLAGFLCGPWWALLVGITAPLLRHFLFSMPPLVTALAMSGELATYGLLSGLMYRRLSKTMSSIYLSLVIAMIAGRIIWGILKVLMTGISGEAFTWAMFLAGAVTNAIPGILIQLILIPVLVSALYKSKILN